MTTAFPVVPASTPVGVVVSLLWPGMAHVALAGEIDMVIGPGMGMRLLAILDHHRPAVLDVDLAAVTFLDCAGIGLLVSIRAAAAHTRCQMRLTCPTGTVAHILDLAAVDLLLSDPITLYESAPTLPAVSEPGRHRRPVAGQAVANKAAA